ncbi:DUF1657 domain-containing protein [Bacillus sp. OK048]|uniref:DUF1657 domain-containing protein n=1 Tax=Bacillus sp. OK048 TaxID=1882761 RepID=UPI00088B283F|nr:DUF1657 domain-containing protein [Bacillus sp. OK048]SDN74718.1 Protein of unknown function [Bacillus sp. OK048]
MTIAASVKQCLSSIKGIEAQLSSLALNSVDEGAKDVFHQTMLTIVDVKKDLQKRVLELERLEPQYKSS